MTKQTHIIIVGGGAGGLELAAQLGKKYKKNSAAKITLIDNKLKHIWKPMLHEVAAGTLPSWADEIDYISYAFSHYFNFSYGALAALDRKNKTLTLAPVFSSTGETILPARILQYDILVIAIGSLTNDFNISGVKENCLFLDNLSQAENFNRNLLLHVLQLLQHNAYKKSLELAIVGAGATGVELAAELHYALHAGMFSEINFKIKLIEATSRILPGLPERIADAVVKNLHELGIEIVLDEKVTRVTPDAIVTQNSVVNADLKIWCAGVKAEQLLTNLDGLETNTINQLAVNSHLQTTLDNYIFAFGDCASCPQINAKGQVYFVPPRAQAAHQQALLLARSLPRLIMGKSLLPYVYKDYGSLITIGRYNVVGLLMNRTAKSLYIQGIWARFSYWSLYKIHQITLWGLWRVMVLTFANALTKNIRPRLKLH